MLNYFVERLKTARTGKLMEVLQINIFTALLSGLKGLVEEKATLGSRDLVTTTTALVTSLLASAHPILRCAAGESLGRMAQVVQDNRITLRRWCRITSS